MKTSITFKTIALAIALAAALSASVLAQTGPGTGPGMGGGPGMQGAGPGHGAGQMGQGSRGMRNMRFDKGNTPGWTLMTTEERTANQTRMRAATTYDECKQLQDEQHKLMETRAKEKGVTLNAPGKNGCDMAKSRGYLK